MSALKLANLPESTRRLAETSPTLPEGVRPSGPRGIVLDAALRLFAEHGFAGASIRDIAQAAGVQPATFYAHYPSKEHLLADLIRIGHEAHHQRLRAALLDSSPDPRQQLMAYVRAHVRMHCELSMLAIVANSELHVLNAELAGPAATLREQSTQLLAEVIERGRRAGVFSVPDTWLAVAAIGGMGLRVAYWFSSHHELSAETVADTYAQFACRIVGVHDSNGVQK